MNGLAKAGDFASFPFSGRARGRVGRGGGETVAMEVRDGKHTIPYWFCDQLVDKLVVITTLSAAIAMGDGQ